MELNGGISTKSSSGKMCYATLAQLFLHVIVLGIQHGGHHNIAFSLSWTREPIKSIPIDCVDKSDDIYIQDIILTVSRLCTAMNSDWLPRLWRMRRSDVVCG